MNHLSVFLPQNAKPLENISYIASDRFVDPETGTPMAWEIRCITSSEDEALRNASMEKVKMSGKKGRYATELNIGKYLALLGSACTVFPNLNDAELQNGYGVMGADALLKAMLTPGEFTNYIEKVQEICGFDRSFEDLTADAKN